MNRAEELILAIFAVGFGMFVILGAVAYMLR